MVVTGSYSLTEACSQELVCPSNCSGHGSCFLGRCECVIAYAGLDCSLMNVMLQCGYPYDIELSAGGTSLYLLQVADLHSRWNLSLVINTGMVDYYLAYNRIPRSYDLDLEAVGVNSSASFSCGTSCQDQLAAHKSVLGTWVLRIAARCCSPIKITAVLRCIDSQQPCDENYFLEGSNCVQCNTSACPVGQYRGACSFPILGKCKSCSTKPNGAIYITAGIPYNQDSCRWACDEGKVFLGEICAAPTISTIGIGMTHSEYVSVTSADLDSKISTRIEEETALLSSPSLQDKTLTSSHLVDLGHNITLIEAGSLHFSVVLPMTTGEFFSMESKYKTAVAAAANCFQEQVRVQAVHDYLGVGRRLQIGAIEVDTVILSQQGADSTPTLLITAELLDQNLKLQGLPPTLSLKFDSGLATSFNTRLMTSKIMASTLPVNSTDSTPVPVQQAATPPVAGAVAGAVAGGCLLVFLGGLAVVRYRRLLFPPGGRVDAPTAAHSNEERSNAGVPVASTCREHSVNAGIVAVLL
jgi:hypothetical protein